MSEIAKQHLLTFWHLVRRIFPSHRHWAINAIVFVSLVLTGVVMVTDVTFAGLLEEGLRLAAFLLAWISTLLARVFMALAVFFLRFFIQLAGYNGYLDAPIVLLGWTMVRDVANMFFVVALLVIAFATILGRESYEWKKTMVKLILMAIFVNFSMLIAGIIIDAAHVFTVTFLNAVAPAAGGNLISMFNLDAIQSIVAPDAAGAGLSDISLELFLGAAFSAVFAGMTMITIGTYCIIMLLRVAHLWVLIILSPLAYIFSILPATAGLAREWWQEFTRYVVVAPIMVFFLWLAFATMGAQDIGTHLSEHSTVPGTSFEQEADAAFNRGQAASVNVASTWHNMAQILVAVAFLWVGIDRVQKTGAAGSGILSGAVNFAKNVGTIATGVAIGRYLTQGATDLGAKGLKAAAWHAPVIGGEKWALRGKNVWQGVKGWYYGKGMELTEEGERLSKERMQLMEQQSIKSDGGAGINQQIDSLQKTKESLIEKQGSDEEWKDEDEETLAAVDQQINDLKSQRNAAMVVDDDALEQRIEDIDKKLLKETGGGQGFLRSWTPGGIIGRSARAGIRLQKQVAKTEKQAEHREKILWKRTGSAAGGYFGGGIAQKLGIGVGMGTRGLFNTGIFGDRYAIEAYEADKAGVKGLHAAQDRIERGWLQAEEMRSKAKDDHFENKGKIQALRMPRFKYDVDKGSLTYQFDKGTLMDQIAKHEMNGESYQSAINILKTDKREKLLREDRKKIDKVLQGKQFQDMTGEIERLNKTIFDLKQDISGLGSEIAKDKKKAETATGMEKVALTESIVKNERKLQQKKDAMESNKGLRLDAQRDFASAFRANIEAMGGNEKLPAWERSRQKALEEHREQFYKAYETEMKDDAGQKHIWDHFGVTTPNNAMFELIEAKRKENASLNYETFVSSVEGYLRAMSDKEASGQELNFEDMTVGAGLMARAMDESWNDDVVIPLFEELKRLMGSAGSSSVGDGMPAKGQSLMDAFQKYRENIASQAAASAQSLTTTQLDATAHVLSELLGSQQAEALTKNIRNQQPRAVAEMKAAILSARGNAANIPRSMTRDAGLSADGNELADQIAKRMEAINKAGIDRIMRKY